VLCSNRLWTLLILASLVRTSREAMKWGKSVRQIRALFGWIWISTCIHSFRTLIRLFIIEERLSLSWVVRRKGKELQRVLHMFTNFRESWRFNRCSLSSDTRTQGSPCRTFFNPLLMRLSSHQGRNSQAPYSSVVAWPHLCQDRTIKLLLLKGHPGSCECLTLYIHA
jgi:hypothetical protein